MTEFLPVSSSGHLVLLQHFLGLSDPMVFFDILLHVGTLAAVFVVYRYDIALMIREIFLVARNGFDDISRFPQARAAMMIVIANVPTALIGITLEDHFEKLFGSPSTVGVMLLLTGTLLFLTRERREGYKNEGEMTIRDALIIGIAQGAAITPGISRAGMTIAIALFLGIKREAAARFSFLLSVPAIAGAALLKLKDAPSAPDDMQIYLAGAGVSFVVGIAALFWLIDWVRKGKLSWFAYYCWGVGAVAILVFSF